MTSITTRAATLAPPGGDESSAVREDRASTVAARRLAWQQAFESALRVPWSAPAGVAAPRVTTFSDGPAPVVRAGSSNIRFEPPSSTAPEGCQRGGRDARALGSASRASDSGRVFSAAESTRHGMTAEGGAIGHADPASERPQPASCVETRAGRESLHRAPRDAKAMEPGVDHREADTVESNGAVEQTALPDMMLAISGGASVFGSAPGIENDGGVAAASTTSGRATHPPRELVFTPLPGVMSAVPAFSVFDLPGSPPAAEELQPPEGAVLLSVADVVETVGAAKDGGAVVVREPVRCHAEWCEDGVRLWIGMDRDREGQVPTVTPAFIDQARSLIEAQGGRLVAVVCNGKVVWDGHRAAAAVATPSDDEASGAREEHDARLHGASFTQERVR